MVVGKLQLQYYDFEMAESLYYLNYVDGTINDAERTSAIQNLLNTFNVLSVLTGVLT